MISGYRSDRDPRAPVKRVTDRRIHLTIPSVEYPGGSVGESGPLSGETGIWNPTDSGSGNNW